MPPRVSIITTVYDRTACLDRCLRSTKHLTFRDFEHIVVSDHPPAHIQPYLRQMCETAGVRYFDLPERTGNWGIGPAEAGLRAANGEFVCFLSDDNAYLPGHFEPLLAAFEADPGLGFVFSSCRYAGRRELRNPIPMGAGIDLGQPLFRRELLGDTIPFREFAWDWCIIHDLMVNKGVRYQHVDEMSFIFRLDAYPELVQALA